MRISKVPNVTPHSTPPPSPGTRGKAGDEYYFLASLLPRLVHPAKLALVEALIEVGEPRSVDDLAQLCELEGKRKEAQRHATEMVEVGALEITSIQIKDGDELPLYFFRQEG